MKLSIAFLFVALSGSASAFLQNKPTFSRTNMIMGAEPSKDDLEKTRKIILDFMNKDEPSDSKEDKSSKKQKEEVEESA